MKILPQDINWVIPQTFMFDNKIKYKFDHKDNEDRDCVKFKSDGSYDGKMEAKKCSEDKVILCEKECTPGMHQN